MEDVHEGTTSRWHVVPPAHGDEDVRRRHESNRAAWNEGAGHYTAGSEERIAELRAGRSNLHPVERAMLSDLGSWCDTAIHLQCASGGDTLSLWLEGATRVVGVDISDVHIENARLTSEALAAPAEWYRCDILDTPHSLDGTADLVYTGRGAVNWIHDIDAWARVCARLLKPGGVVSLFDTHPLTYFFDPDADHWRLLEIDYFAYAESSQGWPETYIGDTLGVPVENQAPKYERVWPTSAVFNALTGAGLPVERFGEHPDEYWDAFPKIAPERRRKSRRPTRCSHESRPHPALDDPSKLGHAAGVDVPETRFARSGEVHIAYQVFGDGPMDLIICGSWQSNVEGRWEVPLMAKFLRRLGAFSRVIIFDKRGVGLSDPVPLQSLPSLEEWMDDVRAVLDDAGSKRAAIYGALDGGVMAMLFAATYPERTAALILEHCYAKIGQAPDYPWGVPDPILAQAPELVRRLWINGHMLSVVAPSRSGDEALREEFARYARSSASPGAAAAMVEMLRHVDVRYVLPSIQAPTLVMHQRDAAFYRVELGRYLADNIPGARFLELPGSDIAWFGDQEAIIAEIEEFLTGVRPAPAHDRVLATVMFTDIVESTRLAAEWGDARWRDFLERHRELSRRQLGIHRGREVQMLGDGFLATFDGPARAIRCASAVLLGSRSLGIDVRSGLHTGECELIGDDVGGIAVHIGARIVSLAGPGEVLVSSTVKDLVVGSGLAFDDRGEHALKGVPGEWRLFAVKN